MNPKTQSVLMAGPVGQLQVALDEPSGPVRGTAVISHPHPLFGGTMDNKVVQTVARAFLQAGWRAVRFNFRGVGESTGVHAEGVGERDDLGAVIDAFAPSGPLALAGFSFGAAVTSHAIQAAFAAGRQIQAAVLVGTAASRFEVAAVPEAWHERTLVVHGEEDDTVPLGAVMDWARPQGLPVTVVPGGEHFFHGRLPLLKGLVVRHLMAEASSQFEA
jgi:alpha/beta superfamily hydrolase